MAQAVYDSWKEFYGGMNGNLLSSIIGTHQYLKGINITCRGGVVRTRPGFEGIDFAFNSPVDERIFTKGKFQGGAIYHATSGTFLVCAVSGNVFVINPDTGQIANVTTITGRLNQYNDRLWFCQVEQYMVVQDGINIPIIMNGMSAKLANHNLLTVATVNQVPVGTIMAYGHGRLFIKVVGNQFLAGDINMPTTPEHVLGFTETQYLNGGGAFGIPGDLGEITGMTFSQNFDSSDGMGPLVVFARNGSDTFAVYMPREVIWGSEDISRVQMRGVGGASHTCIVVTGDDLLFRTFQGLGSYDLFKTSDRRFTDMSDELEPFENQETEWCRSLSSGVLFDNRVLYTLVAEKVDALDLEGNPIDDYRFKSLGVLDLAPLNGLTEVSEERLAAFDGAWTGPHPTLILEGNFDNEDRCFVFGKSNEGMNTLYELGIVPGDDCGETPINCRLYPRYTRFMDVMKQPPSETIYQMKRLERCSLYVSKFSGDVDFKLWVRPDGRTDFKQISAMSLSAPMVACEAPYVNLKGGMAQSRAKVAFPQFNVTLTDPVRGIDILKGYEYEFCLEWNGIAEIRRVSLEATIQDVVPPLDMTKNVLLPAADRDDFDYSIDCQSGRLLGERYYGIFVNGKWVNTTVEDLTPTPAGPAPYQPPATICPDGSYWDDTTQSCLPNPAIPVTPIPLPVPLPNPSQPSPLPPVGYPIPPNPPKPVPPTKPLPPLPPLPPGEPPHPGKPDEVHLTMTCPVTVNDGEAFDVAVHVWVTKYFGNGYSTGPYTRPIGTTITLSLNPANGATLAPLTATVVWTGNQATISGLIASGYTPPETPITIHATVGTADGNATGSCNTAILSGLPDWVATSPMEFDFTQGGADQTGILTVTNNQTGDLLVWDAELVNVAAELVGKVEFVPDTAAGDGLDLGESEQVQVTVQCPADVGSYSATIRFTADVDGKTITQDVVLTVMVAVGPAPIIFPGVPPLLSIYYISSGVGGTRHGPATYDGVVSWIWPGIGGGRITVYWNSGGWWEIIFGGIQDHKKLTGNTPVGEYTVHVTGVNDYWVWDSP